MRQAGVLPEDAPPLGDDIDIDLAEHGFSILRAALSLRELDGTSALCQRAFECAGNAFESLVRNGFPEAEERGFFRTISGAAYHLAGFSAIAYSLFGEQQILDEALQGSLWARQIGRESEAEQQSHQAILAARANVIWSHTTPQARKGHYAMGVGLEAGLAIDQMADVLGMLVDQADEAALRDDAEALAAALAQLAARFLVIRPFVPDKKNTLPPDWGHILKEWVSGTDVNVIGAENMRIIEDAFAYRLVWALEALRTRRVTLGWSSEIVSGGGAASLETGVPQLMMSMLIRAGLPSRRAAIAAIRTTGAVFVTGADMRAWLASEEIAELTDAGDFPTPETAVLWQRFRDDLLSVAQQKWSVGRGTRALVIGADAEVPPEGTYRIEFDVPHGDAWMTTPDYRRVAKFSTRAKGARGGLFAARLKEGQREAQIERFGSGVVKWPK